MKYAWRNLIGYSRAKQCSNTSHDVINILNKKEDFVMGRVAHTRLNWYEPALCGLCSDEHTKNSILINLNAF